MQRRHFMGTLGAAALGGARPRLSRSTTGDPIDYAPTGVKLLAGAPQGFRMPAEWERHERTVMAFATPANWRRGQCDRARAEWAAVARAIRMFEPVTMYAKPGEGKLARRMCGEGVRVVEVPLDAGWTRDTAAQVIVNAKGERRATGFGFNAWGGKFPNVRDDRLVKGRICADLKLSMHAAPLVCEGGSLTVDGEGTLIAVEESIVNKNRNPGMTRDQVERVLCDYLGLKRVIWLAKGLVPDPITDGHVDGICCFVRPGVVMAHTIEDPEDPNHAICRDAVKRLRAAKDARGRQLEVIELPLSADDVVHMNFYVCNGGLIVPVQGEVKQDEPALKIIDRAFPKHRLVPVMGRTIAIGGGGIHCITQQIPAAPARAR